MEYLYDNTFDGLLTCFYEHVYTEKADSIQPLRKDVQLSLGRQTQVQTDLTKSEKVAKAIEKKISKICHDVYHAKHMFILANARNKAKEIEALGYRDLPICMAKTQYSFSDNPKLLGAPQDFTVQITNVKVCAGAGFIVAYAGDIMTMPGLPKVPSAEKIDIDENGVISGLF